MPTEYEEYAQAPAPSESADPYGEPVKKPESAPVKELVSEPAIDKPQLPVGMVQSPFGKHDPVPAAIDQLAPNQWVLLSSAIGLSGMTEGIANSLSLEEVGADQLVFHYTQEQEAMLTEVQQDRISDALNNYFAGTVAVEFRLASQTNETPRLFQQRKQYERLQQAIAALQADPVVQALATDFGAALDIASVRPIGE